MDAGWGRVGVLVGRELSSKTKVDLAQVIHLWVAGPHGRKDLADRAEILLNGPLADGLSIGGK